jgi:hypothetical protein
MAGRWRRRGAGLAILGGCGPASIRPITIAVRQGRDKKTAGREGDATDKLKWSGLRARLPSCADPVECEHFAAVVAGERSSSASQCLASSRSSTRQLRRRLPLTLSLLDA